MIAFFAALLTFFLPFERIPSIDIAGTTIRISSLVLLGFLAVGIPYLTTRREFRTRTKLDWAVITLFILYSLTSLVAISFHRSLVVMAFFGLVLIGYLIVSLINSARVYTQIINMLIITATISAVFGLYQFFGDAFGLSTTLTGLLPRYTSQVFGFARIQSFGVEPLYYANFLLLPIFLLVSRVTGGLARKIDWGILGLLLITFILTLSRGAYIALLVGLIVVATVGLVKKLIKKELVVRLIMLIVFSGVISGIAVTAVSGRTGLRTFGNQASIKESPVPGSTTSRLDHYRQAFRIFSEHPLLGVGAGNYDEASQLPNTPLDKGRQIVNNQYLETLAEAGMVGFAGLLLVLGVALYTLWKLINEKRSLLALGLLGGLVGIIIQYNFFSTIYILYIWYVFGMISSLERSGNEVAA